MVMWQPLSHCGEVDQSAQEQPASRTSWWQTWMGDYGINKGCSDQGNLLIRPWKFFLSQETQALSR